MSINRLNQERGDTYYKDPDEEEFLEQVNDALNQLERNLYQPGEASYPFLFTFGPPRSGTTLLSQTVAHGLEVGFINNFAARFWKAPVCGIRLSQIMYDKHQQSTNFRSQYGSTDSMLDLHEFGYFWRDWLKKDTFESIKNAKAEESSINWSGLKEVLVNIQRQFDRAVVFKNILGSYHLPRFKELLEQVLFIYIERDPLDAAVSILDARKKYYNDPDTWWSYVPPEYEKIIDEDYWTQIAGQIYYLQKFYNSEFEKLNDDIVIRTTYENLCNDPKALISEINKKLESNYGYRAAYTDQLPDHFTYRTYNDRSEEKEKFKNAFKSIENHER